jgi:hypothetical protein
MLESMLSLFKKSDWFVRDAVELQYCEVFRFGLSSCLFIYLFIQHIFSLDAKWTNISILSIFLLTLKIRIIIDKKIYVHRFNKKRQAAHATTASTSKKTNQNSKLRWLMTRQPQANSH